MKNKDFDKFKYLLRTSYIHNKKYDNIPESRYTNAWGLILIPLIIFISIIYYTFKVWL